MQVYNRTDLTEEDIRVLPKLGTTIRRGRTIDIYECPNEPLYVVTVTTFDETLRVIAKERGTDYTTALLYAARGKIYVSQ